MKRNTLILVLIAGLCLVMLGMAQTPSPGPDANTTSPFRAPESNISVPAENQSVGNVSGPYMQGELLVKFDPMAYPNMNALTATSMQAHASIGAVIIPDFEGTPGWQHIRLPSAMKLEDAMAYYQTIPTVQYVEVNAVYSIANASDTGNTSVFPPPAGNTTGTGDVLVQYNTTAFASPEDLQEFANVTNTAINATVVTDYTPYGMAGLQLVQLPVNMTTEQGITYYNTTPNVRYAEPNVQYTAISANQTNQQNTTA